MPEIAKRYPLQVIEWAYEDILLKIKAENELTATIRKVFEPKMKLMRRSYLGRLLDLLDPCNVCTNQSQDRMPENKKSNQRSSGSSDLQNQIDMAITELF